MIGDSGESVNAFQERVAKTLSDYTKGNMNANDFRNNLREYNALDPKVDNMIRRHEAGDF